MRELRRKILLPVFQLSELAEFDDVGSIQRSIRQGKGHPALDYRYRLVCDDEGARQFSYNLFPVVLDRKSVPWALGTLFILSQLQAESRPVMATFHSRADDLGAFKEWLDGQENPELLLFNFPKAKLRRTTYRYRGFLQKQIQAREIGTGTAKRRMATVIRFYMWLVTNHYFTPEFPTWDDGRQLSKIIVSTDLRIPDPKPEDDFDGAIQDGGKLRPLNRDEQEWVLEAAEAKGNSECLLLQLFMLSTGARIESACTLRARHFADVLPHYSKNPVGPGEVLRLKAGPGTGIETKNNKLGTFQIPRTLYELLYTYTHSERARLRRLRYESKHGPHADIYLFLTQQGNSYYISKDESQQFRLELKVRHAKNGQTIRQFIKDQAIPYVRERFDKSFFYRPHDLRASYGMNVTEELMRQVQGSQLTLHKARLIVKDLMWHKSSATTDQYLDYKGKIDAFYKAIDGYGEHLRLWTDRAMKGFSVDE